MKREAKDRVVWMNAKDGAFSIESLYFIIKSAHAIPFPNVIIWNN